MGKVELADSKVKLGFFNDVRGKSLTGEQRKAWGRLEVAWTICQEWSQESDLAFHLHKSALIMYFTHRQQAKTTPLGLVPRRFSQCRRLGFTESRFIESLRGATTNPRYLRSYGGLVSLSLFWLRQHGVVTFEKRICYTHRLYVCSTMAYGERILSLDIRRSHLRWLGD